MGGGVAVEELPYHFAYRRCPFGSYRVPVYNPAFHGYWSDDRWGTSRDNSVYGGHAVPMFVVQTPIEGDASSLARKRKLDGLNGEGGGVAVEELPYHFAYRRCPFGSYRVPVYNPAFHGYWSDDRWGTSRDSSVYGGHAVPMFVVQTPIEGDASSLARKRKLDGLNGEEISRRGHDVITRNILVENNSSKASEGVFQSKSMHTPTVSSSDLATTPAHFIQSSQANPTNSMHPSESNFVKSAAPPRVKSIPVTSTDEGKDTIIKCTVTPEEGTKKLRNAKFDEGAAILLIQSRFRGYQVRKTAPLSQLHHIAHIKSQLKDLEEKVSDADFINNAKENAVARVKLTEGIMNLLLELDTIQGAHSDVRAVRKVVTKDVISLQGRVDLLLSAEVADVESLQLSKDIEEESRAETDLEKLTAAELRSNDSVSEPNERAADEMERIVAQHDQPTEGQIRREISFKIESPSDSRHEEDCGKVDFSLVSVERTLEAAEVTTAEADALRTNTNAEQAAAQSGNVSGCFPQDRVLRNVEREREELDDKTIESEQHSAADVSKPCDGLNAKDERSPEESSSPRSPFEAADCLDFQPSNPENELESELQEYPGINQSVSAQTDSENQDLLLRLSDENKSLKSLLFSVIKWNQMQATAMQDVNHRLGRLESRIGRKKSSSRRKVGKHSRMPF